MSFKAIETVLFVAPPSESKGGPGDAAPETDQAGILRFLVKLIPSKAKGDLLIHSLSLTL